MANITKKVTIYVYFAEKLQTFDLRALGGSFCRKFGWGQFILFYDRGKKPFVCDHCEYSSTQAQALKKKDKSSRIVKIGLMQQPMQSLLHNGSGTQNTQDDPQR